MTKVDRPIKARYELDTASIADALARLQSATLACVRDTHLR
jgi:hypothetical protein